MKKLGLLIAFLISAKVSAQIFVEGSGPITNANFAANFFQKYSVSSTNVTALPQEIQVASGTNLVPDFAQSMTHEFTLTGNSTLALPSNLASTMAGKLFLLVLIQDGTGGRQCVAATNYYDGDTVRIGTNRVLILNTNIGYRNFFSVYVRSNLVTLDVIGGVTGYRP